MPVDFLNKIVIVRRTNNSFVRGICRDYSSDGITLEVENSNRAVFVPKEIVLEVIIPKEDKL